MDVREYRRKLPHLHPDERYLFLTWRLWRAIPRRKPDVLYAASGQRFAAEDRELALFASGPRWLSDPRIADVVANAILRGDNQRQFYELYAWVVMPNHVHILVLPLAPAAIFMRWLKGSSARSANGILGRTGEQFWQDESYDHYLRKGDQLARTVNYIEQNPVAAGIVGSPEHWPWSSARRCPGERQRS